MKINDRAAEQAALVLKRNQLFESELLLSTGVERMLHGAALHTFMAAARSAMQHYCGKVASLDEAQLIRPALQRLGVCPIMDRSDIWLRSRQDHELLKAWATTVTVELLLKRRRAALRAEAQRNIEDFATGCASKEVIELLAHARLNPVVARGRYSSPAKVLLAMGQKIDKITRYAGVKTILGLRSVQRYRTLIEGSLHPDVLRELWDINLTDNPEKVGAHYPGTKGVRIEKVEGRIALATWADYNE